MDKINTEQIDKVIVGYVEPHIYAFRTGTIPEYTKVGDTIRPVSVRLNEWKDKFPDLEELDNWSAKIKNSDLYFRDYSVHEYLEDTLNKHRLTENENPAEYYSNEFFENTDRKDIENSIEDINKNKGNYDLYNIGKRTKEIIVYTRGNCWKPRPNQEITVENFKKAVENGRNKLLMYAVMRFGKSFTSLLCAKEMGYKFIIVVSAKADVKEEWKKNVEIPGNFKGYKFIDSEFLLNDSSVINNIDENNRYVLFLTLQDLQGNEIKDKHKAIFEKNDILDMVIVDETHFGARGESYGEVLKCDDNSTEDYEDFETCDKEIKKLNPKVFLHLSGTPYRILMSNEFSDDDIIASFRYSDVMEEQDKWNKDNLDNEEWENPYFGFPQMIRFALNPNKSSLALLNKLKEQGKTYSLSALFETKSIKKDNKNKDHEKFKNENEVLDLFRLIDGSQTEEDFFGFLNYDKLKDGQMCRHIVCALPFRASCDALEKLLNDHKNEFTNLCCYEIINIAGHNQKSKKISQIKGKITDCDRNNKKTISLTCNKMLTGTTVKEWDTMLFLKETNSPQEYDQAIYRIQNQNTETYKSNDKIIKINKKPQTLLVDFSPARMFSFKENEAFVYSVLNKNSNSENIEKELKKETEISPIFVINSNKIQKVTETDIIDKIRDYSKDRGVFEELNDIGIDLNIQNEPDLCKIIDRENEIGSKNGFNTKAYEGEETALDDGDEDQNTAPTNNPGNNTENTGGEKLSENDEKSFIKKLKAYHAKLLFYAFLTEDTVKSINEIISSLNKKENERIFRNIGLNEKELKLIYDYYKKDNSFVLRELEHKINNINNLANDKTVNPIDRAKTALYKFNRLGESEIVTPLKISRDMINLLPEDMFKNTDKNFLDIASKEGEFAISIADRYAENNIDISQIKDCIYSIPTSSITYEFTRKVYGLLGLNTDNIATFNSYDLLNVKKKDKKKETTDYDKIRKIICQKKNFSEIKINDDVENIEEKDMIQFDAVVGNPPYQLDDGGHGASATSIYNYFVENAKKLNSNYISIIMPARWYAGGKGLDNFRSEMLKDTKIKVLHDFIRADSIFPGVEIKGGVCYFLWDRDYTGKCDIITHYNSGEISKDKRYLKYNNSDIYVRHNEAIPILDKIQKFGEKSFSKIVSSRKPFGLATNFTDFNDKEFPNSTFIYANQKKGYIDNKNISAYINLVKKYKVYIPEAIGAGNVENDMINPILGNKKTCCTETYLLIGPFDNKKESENAITYIKTKFFHYLLSLKKITQHTTSKVYEFIPMQDFSKPWTDAELYDKYGLTQKERDYIENLVWSGIKSK